MSQSTIAQPDLQGVEIIDGIPYSPKDKADYQNWQKARAEECRKKRALLVAEEALSLWLCWHDAVPYEVIPFILKKIAGEIISEDEVDAISARARKWTRREHTYHPKHDPAVIVRLAKQGGRK